MELSDIVREFAAAMTVADNRKPAAVSPRSGRVYRPGLDRILKIVLLILWYRNSPRRSPNGTCACAFATPVANKRAT